MSGPPRSSRCWLAIALALAALPGLLLSSCDDSLTLAPEASASPEDAALQTQAEPSPAFEQILDPAFILTGCWRPVEADGQTASGGEFFFRQVAPDAFVFESGGTPRTKLVVSAKGFFQEVNYDDKYPFFPPGYIHSVGQIAADGTRLERKLNNVELPRIYRRCAEVSLPLDTVSGTPEQQSAESPTPIPLITPLMLTQPGGPGTPKPTRRPGGGVNSVYIPPDLTPTPTPTPRPTLTPYPTVTPLLPPSYTSPTPEVTPLLPAVSPTPEATADSSSPAPTDSPTT